MSLIDRIEREMQLDDEDREAQSAKLAAAYTKAPEAVQDAIDECFIALCGWSLSTLIDNPNIGQG